jgi:hypothetical protein
LFFDAFPPELVCGSILHCLMYASVRNSAIVPDIPKLFEAFKEKHRHFCGAAATTLSVRVTFTAAGTGTRAR